MPRDQTRPPLSDAEWQIMKVLWEHGDMALGEVIERLPPGQDWAYSTVKTFMQRMVTKRWLAARKVGSSYLYRPLVPKKKALGRAIKEFSQNVLDGVLTPVVAYYAEAKGLSEDELSELERIVESHQKSRGGRA